MKFINIHTHKHPKQSKNISVINLFPEDINKISENNLYSIGLHPWYVNFDNFEEKISIVNEFSLKKEVVAIGEIGLDKLKPNFELQTQVFEKQIDIAIGNNLPIIIHTVKSFDEIIKILKNKNFKTQVVIHRFSGNLQQAEQLIKLGYFLSFGDILFNKKSKTTKAFAEIPLQNIFFETDDSNSRIADIYAEASQIKSISLEKLQNQISENLQNFLSNNER